MERKAYKIDHSNNNFKIYDPENKLKFTASWFLGFGKSTSEVYDLENKILFTIVKKFNFWKGQISYIILNKNKETLVLRANKKENNIFELELKDDLYEVQVHYSQKKSICKNGLKIAEINDGFLSSKEESTSNILLSSIADLELVFLLFTCLKTGETHQKSLIKSQKKLIPLQENWNS